MMLVLVIPHEWGHLIVAKKCGVKVNEFSVGMGPLLFKTQRGETQYSFRLLPLGGYCAMEGEEEASDDPRSYYAKSNGQKVAILLAGVTMNVIIAIVVMSVMVALTGVPTTKIETVTSGYPAEAAGIETGDKLLEINGNKISYWEDVSELVGEYTEGDKMELTIKRDGEELTVLLTPQWNEEEQRYMIGIVPSSSRNPLLCLRYGAISTWNMNVMLVDAFRSMFTQGIDKDDVSGPVGLVQAVDKTNDYGAEYYLMLLALVSLNLAIFNLLPIPGLDGGKIFFIILKVISGGRINDDMEYKATVAGMILLLSVFVLVTVNDVSNLFG